MRRITAWIQQHLHVRTFLPVLVTALATTWYGLFWSVEHFAELTGGLIFMDMQPGLTTPELFTQIGSYSTDAIRYYQTWIVFDFVWPFVTFSTMCFISAWLVRFAGDSWNARLWLLIGCAYTTVLFDWAENLGFLWLISALPEEPVWLARGTLTLHAGKLFFNLLFNATFLALLVAVIAARVHRARQPRL